MASYWGTRGSSAAVARRSGRAIFGQRDRAQSDYYLAYQRLIERHASRGEARGGGRVGMHHSLNVRPQPVNQQVHGDFARHVAASFQTAALHVHNDQVRRLHHALAHGRRSGQDTVFVQAHRKIAIHRGHVAPLVQGPAEEDDFAPILTFAGHRFREGGPQAPAVSAYVNPTS